MLQTIKHTLEQPRTIAVVIVLAAMLSAAGLVLADTATTSVTVGNAVPVISNVSLNGNTDITLTENTFIYATVTMTITDSNGVGTNSGGACSGVTSADAQIYLASTTNNGTTCTYNGENCYTPTATGCIASTTSDNCTGGADTTVDYECGFAIWYVAQGTDASGWTSSIWSAAATSSDGTDTGTATNTGQTVEVNTLIAHNVSTPLAYGTVSANSNTGTTNSTTTITNTGNVAQDTFLRGDHMCTDYPTCAGGAPPTIIATTSQEYALAPFDFDTAGTDITGSNVEAETDGLVKPTATTTAVTDLVSWGIEVAVGTPTGSYTGLNTFTGKVND